MPSDSFDPYNESSLDWPIFVLRDSLGYLAVQILSEKEDLSKMRKDYMLKELLDIIEELHEVYHQTFS